MAQEVRGLREAAELKQSDVVKRLRCNSAKVARMESTRNTISGSDLEVMLALFDVGTLRSGCTRSSARPLLPVAQWPSQKPGQWPVSAGGELPNVESAIR
ncbi:MULTISPECIES: helix-turn-helix domain-containing protein [Actinopolyspora]|uniref:Helix-turn-helix domain-containing protein n=1 Tax=Actinopolyspora saharensis TaxID=995062 RepID=A0A1H0Y3K8_9ACTN|nr:MULTISPECIES: helix-turn-helix transcriptional regulator [Actinopolyspora]SDQ09526.1 Helix-turn-helix domain-containing protein [Actinopolyspora saharensis]